MDDMTTQRPDSAYRPRTEAQIQQRRRGRNNYYSPACYKTSSRKNTVFRRGLNVDSDDDDANSVAPVLVQRWLSQVATGY